MNGVCEAIFQSLKKQNVLIFEKSGVKNNNNESDPQKYINEVDTYILKNGHQSNGRKVFITDEKRFDLINPYFEFRLKPDNSNIDSHFAVNRKTKQLYLGNCNPSEGEKIQTLSLSIIDNGSDYSIASLSNGIENGTNSFEEIGEIDEKKHQEAMQLKSTNENKAPKKRRLEDEVFRSPMLEECNAARETKIFKTETECFVGNPYLEFILNSDHDLYFNGSSDGYEANDFVSGRKEKMRKKDGRRIKNDLDIFGNHLTSKDRNKFKVICPHCTKKVPAPGFVRHLTYCMRVSIRKSTRRS